MRIQIASRNRATGVAVNLMQKPAKVLLPLLSHPVADAAALIFSAYCNGIRGDFHHSPMAGPFGLHALALQRRLRGVILSRLPDAPRPLLHPVAR